MTLSEKRRHWSQMFATLVLWCHAHGHDVAIDTTRRSKEEQRRLVDSGASQTMKSKHVEGLAGDLLLYKGKLYVTDPMGYAPIGAYWLSLDAANIWGGSWTGFRDYGHFEYNG